MRWYIAIISKLNNKIIVQNEFYNLQSTYRFLYHREVRDNHL
jgi:hypothetical protein